MVTTKNNISPLESKQARAVKEKAFLQLVAKIKDGKCRPEEIEESELSAHLKEVATGLYEGYAEQGLAGYEKAYDALSPDLALLKKHRKQLRDKPTYAGTLLCDVKPEKVRWLWKDRLALGKITTLDGDPGLGKSLIGANLAARITWGKDMPDGTPCLERGGVVLIMAEDGLEDTIQPRFARAGADLSKVSSIGTIKVEDESGNVMERGFCLPDDLPLLEREIERVNAKLVYIDPITAVLGSGAGKDTYKDTEVRSMLFPLKTLVEKHSVACVMVRHLTKSRGDNPLMAGNGSMAFIALARTGLMVIRDPEDESQAILSHIKSNIGPIAKGLKYKIYSDADQGDDRPYLQWGETTNLSGTELIAAPRRNTGSNRQQILDLLKEKAPDGLTIQELAELLPDVTMGNLKMTLKRMYDAGEISKSERGSYCAK